MTLGNIDPDIRAQPSRNAWILVAYLPTAKLDGLHLGEEAERLARARLFHHCMKIIVEPLKRLGNNGKMMVGGDGYIRHCFPVLTCYVADYPEQSLVCCTRAGSTCPQCPTVKEDFHRNDHPPIRDKNQTLRTIRRACGQPTAARQEECLKSAGFTGVDEPFWADLPHCNIHEAITPDLFHQLYQGLVKHAVRWVQRVVGKDELDARFQRMPPAHGIRIFDSGISNLKCVSGPEHREISRQLLGCMLGSAPVEVVRATRALLDFLYIARYRSHSTETLGYLQDALDAFHQDKDAFIEWEARVHLNLPKLHSLQHYIDSIRLFGTTNNYNTEYTERLHIDYVKDAYRRSSKKEATRQMTRWLLRREAMANFTAYIEWRTQKPTHLTTSL